MSVKFTIIGMINRQRTFATGKGIRDVKRLQRIYGKGRWRKRKEIARIRLQDGTIQTAEVHWYEAPGIGRKEYKIKYLLE